MIDHPRAGCTKQWQRLFICDAAPAHNSFTIFLHDADIFLIQESFIEAMHFRASRMFCLFITISILIGIARQAAADGSNVVVFVGTTPCGPGVRPFHKVAGGSDCAAIKWRLTLHGDGAAAPAAYSLSAVYGFIDYNPNQILDRGTNVIQGQWRIVKGTTSDPEAVVFQLECDQPGVTLRLLKMDENVLQVLTTNGNLMIGDEFQSYTLNREKL